MFWTLHVASLKEPFQQGYYDSHLLGGRATVQGGQGSKAGLETCDLTPKPTLGGRGCRWHRRARKDWQAERPAGGHIKGAAEWEGQAEQQESALKMPQLCPLPHQPHCVRSTSSSSGDCRSWALHVRPLGRLVFWVCRGGVWVLEKLPRLS